MGFSLTTGNKEKYIEQDEMKYGQKCKAMFFLLRRDDIKPPKRMEEILEKEKILFQKITKRLEKEKMKVKTCIKSRSR